MVSRNGPLVRTVVCRVLLSADQQLGVEQLAVRTSSDLINRLCPSAAHPAGHRIPTTYRGVQVDEDGPGHIFAGTSLGEERLERPALVEVLRIGVGTAVGRETMLKEVPKGYRVSFGARAAWVVSKSLQLPSAVAKLRASLADMKVADLESSVLASGSLRSRG